jgi:FkbM family methyltransferase
MQPLPPLVPGELADGDFLKLIGRPDPVILDIGCNDGAEIDRFLKMFPKCQVHAFEPDPRPRARFKKHIRDKRVKLWPLAISAQDGEAEFHLSSADQAPTGVQMPEGGEWDLSGSLRKPAKHLDFHPWVKFDKTMKVETMRLDTFTQRNRITRIDFIWADVQGAEADLIAGAAESLKFTRYVYTEYNENEMYQGQVGLRKLIELLPEFEVVVRFPDDVLLRNRSFR